VVSEGLGHVREQPQVLRFSLRMTVFWATAKNAGESLHPTLRKKREGWGTRAVGAVER
jgi:hypothetical protein